MTVSRPRLYARTPPIQNLGETEVAWEKSIFLFFWVTFFHKKARARAHVHVPTCTWGMWSENMECRVDTHGAMKKNLSQFGGRKP